MLSEGKLKELKPCPFCGDDQSSFAGNCEGAFARCSDGTLSVNCCCGVTGPAGADGLAAIRAWNTRAQAPAPVAYPPVAYLKEWDSHIPFPPARRRRADLAPALERWMPADTKVTPLFAVPASPAAAAASALPIDLAPRDGSMLRLLINYSPKANAADIAKTEAEGYLWSGNALEDAEQAWTIGFNSLGNTGEDAWQFVGWDWSQDCFTAGRGKVVGWLPFHGEAQAPAPVGGEVVGWRVRNADGRYFFASNENAAFWRDVHGFTIEPLCLAALSPDPTEGGEDE